MVCQSLGKCLVVTAIAAGICLQHSRSLNAQPRVPRNVETSGSDLVTPETQEAIDQGLAWLAAQQNPDGSFGVAGQYRHDVAVTALTGMAFLTAGHTPGRGKYGRNVGRALEFILTSTKPNGYIISPDSDYHGPMYGHGFATLFLAEVYGMTRRKDLRNKLEKSVKLIIDSQNKDGGWRYHPDGKDADISVTICQIMALRAARNAGIYVPKDTVTKCIEYVKRSQNPDGGFQYRLISPRQSLFPRSAAGVVALYSAGIYKGREIERGVNYLLRHLPGKDVYRYDSHYFYGHYYAVQAMWHAGGQYWRRWYPAIRDELLRRRQLPEGNWPYKNVNTEYGTAMACIILQLPNNYLPIFQR